MTGRCPGDQVVAVLDTSDDNTDTSLYYIVNIGVVTRILRSATPGTRHVGLLTRDITTCDQAVTIGSGSQVTMKSVARVPNCKLKVILRI